MSKTPDRSDLQDQSIQLLRLAVRRHGSKLAYPCSFGAEGMVLVDLISRHTPGIRIVTLDTGRLPQATYDLIDECRNHYNIDIEVICPDAHEVEEMVRRRGLNLFYHSVENRKLCCEIRKVRPLRRALRGMEAWITGRTRDQSKDRRDMQAIEDDPVFGLIKYNPLIEWGWQDVWDYIRAHDVPYNRLHDEHYVSIGCEPCTRPITVGEDPRAGRWWWEQEEHAAAECGLHMNPIQKGEKRS
jgi:phosphoadenosine phosphosulfate reductase